MLDQSKLKKFDRKDYRDEYLETTVRAGLAYQIRALRAKLDLSQSEFAVLTDKKQSTISRLEDTEYGRVSVQTLLDIAKAVGVAVVIRFVDYPTFLGFAGKMSTPQLQPDTIMESLERLSEPVRPYSPDHLLWASPAKQLPPAPKASVLNLYASKQIQKSHSNLGRSPWN